MFRNYAVLKEIDNEKGGGSRTTSVPPMATPKATEETHMMGMQRQGVLETPKAQRQEQQQQYSQMVMMNDHPENPWFKRAQLQQQQQQQQM